MLTKQLKPNKGNEHILVQFMTDVESSGLTNAIDYIGHLMEAMPVAPRLDTQLIAQLTETISSQQRTIELQSQTIADLLKQQTIADHHTKADLPVSAVVDVVEEESEDTHTSVNTVPEVPPNAITADKFKELYGMDEKKYSQVGAIAKTGHWVADDGVKWKRFGTRKNRMWAPV